MLKYGSINLYVHVLRYMGSVLYGDWVIWGLYYMGTVYMGTISAMTSSMHDSISILQNGDKFSEDGV